MWLLYVTFEDFVCLKYPNKSKEILTTRINIDTYISSPGSSPVRRPRSPSVIATSQKEIIQSKRVLCEDFKNQVGFKPIQTESRCPTIRDKEFEYKRRYSTTVSYQIAKIQRIVKTERAKKTRNNRQKFDLDGSAGVSSMEIGRADQWNRNRDRMHDLSEGRLGSVGSTNQGVCRSSRCVNSQGTADKTVNSRVIVSGAVTESHGVLLRGSVPRQSQNSATLGPNNGQVRRYNPQVGLENRCLSHTDRLNQSADQIHSVGRCVRNPARVETTHCGPRIVNVRALQAITDNALREDPCITNKLSVQSKCWNSLRLQGILPLDNCRFDWDSGSMNDRIMTDPLRVSVRHDISFHSQDGGYLHPRPDSVVPRHKPPQTLSLDRVNLAGRSDNKITSTPDDSAHDVSADIFHSNESSPVTISSGYESDSLHTCEADIDNIFFKRNKANNVSTKTAEGDNDPLTDYFSMSDSNLNAEVTAPVDGDVTPTSSPQVILNRMPDNQGKDNSVPNDLKSNSKSRKPKQDRVLTPQQGNSAVFSPKERNSYQLTKVARSMFEIIHDLQTEENSAEGKKKGRKPRRNTPPLKPERLIGDNPNLPSSSSSSETTPTNTCTKTGLGQDQFKAIKPLQTQCDNVLTNVNQVPQPKHFDRVVGNPPKVSVRCLRRPLGADPTDFDRNAALPHSDSARASTNENPSKSASQPCYLEEDTSVAANDNSTVHWEGSGNDVHPFHPQVPDNMTTPRPAMINQNWTTNINDCMPYATTRLPGCQTPKRDPRDDHVYETIPGDEMLSYEEHMRLRMNGIPVKLQRLHPDCPFVPYEPPALPARNDHRMPKSSGFMNSSFIMHTQPFIPQNLIQCPRNRVSHPQSLMPQFSSFPGNQRGNVNHGILFNAAQQQHINRVKSETSDSTVIKNSKKQPKQRPSSQELPVKPQPLLPTGYKQKRPVSEQLSQAHKAPAQRRLQLLQKQQLIRQQQQLQLLQQKQELEKQQKILQYKQQQQEKQEQQKQQYLLMRDINSNIPERASFSAISTHHHVNKSRSRANSWDGYGSMDLRKVNENAPLSKGASKLSTSDLLDYIDDIKQPPPKRRENFYLLLSNRQNRADFSESLEIESKLKDLGISVNQVKCGEFLDEDGYTTMDSPPLDFGIETGPQFLQSTYV
ncbi:uncharacterized protein LOC132558577 [Ylistrum balloti]|uniref:uncharacterized protein LOC132558577 n=1 Tax=Ylistrum balloti TaxID=509963 RepID=UPI002905F663|nr:uncharacterized protein LOC132558577 [Ylistrum balloti]